MNVPFVDLKRLHGKNRKKIDREISSVIDSCDFIMGKNCQSFEKEFARFCGSKNSIGVSSGSDALLLALKSLGIGRGDEVITTPLTFVATADTILRCGARPVFADIAPETHVLDPRELEQAVTKRTKAILPVHLYGYVCDMTAIRKVARKHGLAVIEDACQAHGAVYRGRKAGTFGDMGCFSFYPAKNLGAFGDAGAIVTDRTVLYRNIAVLRDYGQREKYFHTLVGYNARMDEIQAAVLRIGLKDLEERNEQRINAARLYNELLSGVPGIQLPVPEYNGRHVFHLYAIMAENRDELRERLCSKGIGTGLHYPYPLHLQKAYAFLGYGKKRFPRAERAAERTISLPMFPGITEKEIRTVARAVAGFYG